MLENPPPPEESNRPDRIPSTNRHWIQNGLKAAFIGALYISVIAVTLIFSITSPELLFLIMIIFLGIYVVYTSKIVRRLFASQIGMPVRIQSAYFIAALAIAALLLMSLTAYILRTSPLSDSDLTTVFGMMLGGAFFVGLATNLNSRGESSYKPIFEFAKGSSLVSNPRIIATTLGVCFLVIEAEISGNKLQISWLQHVSFWIQGALFWGGVILVGLGISGSAGTRSVQQAVKRVRSRDLHTFAFIAVIVLAFVIRAWDLSGSLPISIDDAINIPQAFALLSDTPKAGLLAQVGTYQTSQVYAQLMAISIRLIGYNFTGARAINIVFGTLNVIALYLLANALFDRKVAFVSALVLATFPVHVHFSRLTFLHMADATFGTFAIAFLVCGLKTNKQIYWAAAGISLGLTQYFFEAGRLFYPPLITIWLGVVIIFNFKQSRRLFRGLGIFVVTTVLIATPVYYAAWARSSPFAGRLNESGAGVNYWLNLAQNASLRNLFNELSPPFLAYVRFPEQSLYYGGDHPMVLEYLVPILLLGTFYLIWTWRKPGLIAVFWLLATAGANLLVQHTNGVVYPRYIVGLPAIALIIAVGICYVLPMMLLPLKDRRLALTIPTIITILICTLQVNYYFNEHLPTEKLQLRAHDPFPDTTDAAIRMADMPPGTQVYLISDVVADPNIPRDIVSLYRWNQPLPYLTLDALVPRQVTADFLWSLPLDKDYAFFVEPDHDYIVSRLKATLVLNQPQYSSEMDIPPNKGFILYFAPLDKQHQKF